jgi:uncharacterized protein
MDKQYYVLHLIPKRADFATTMTESERQIMGSHIAYWNERMSQGKVYAFGPVMDPAGIYGLGIISAENEEEVKEFISGDPAVQINRYEYFPMRAVVPDIKP